MAFEFFGRKKRNEELMVSILKGDRQEVDRLLQQKANPNFQFKTKSSFSSSMTPLHTAMFGKNGPDLHIIQALLNKGANPNTIEHSKDPHDNTPYESVLMLAVDNAAQAFKSQTSSDQERQMHTDIYCALRAAGADMYCTPSKHEYKGDMSFANMDYMEWDISIDRFLDERNLRGVWESLEQTYETRRQKKKLNEAIEQQSATAQPTRRLKL